MQAYSVGADLSALCESVAPTVAQLVSKKLPFVHEKSMTNESKLNKHLVSRLNQQSKQIEQLRLKVVSLQEALIRSNALPTCELDHSLASINPIVTRILPGTRNTVIAFGGLTTRLGMPPAEFLKSLVNKNINIIFVKDFHQCWYQQGLLGLSNDIIGTLAVLNKQIPERQENIYTLGASAGGFAAILFGVLMNAHKVIAFGPQTVLTKEVFHLFKLLDSRLHGMKFGDKYSDLKKLLEETEYNGLIHIHFAKHHEHDNAAAEYLGHLKNVHLYPWETEDHNVAVWLKKHDKLDAILNSLQE